MIPFVGWDRESRGCFAGLMLDPDVKSNLCVEFASSRACLEEDYFLVKFWCLV